MEDQLAELRDADRSLFPGSFTIRAIRDSRYHSTAYAIAELIDNSVEAGAPLVELLCMEDSQLAEVRTRRRVSEIAVLDNGEGMSARTLLDALKFGGGTRHDSNTGIGKYGMGLPTSSMSQCKKVDVWTWQNGLDSALHSSIDADEIEKGNHEVPIPNRDTPIPDTWRSAGSDEIYRSRSGTLVVWSNLDKIQWKTSKAIIENLSREVGRIHRHYINQEIHRIQAASFLKDRASELKNRIRIVANDPLYLMTPSSTPEGWDTKAMFREWGPTKDYTVWVDDREAVIQVKYSIVKAEALKTDSISQLPGNTERGRHARHNIGVSVVREDRELVLEDAFLREGGSTENPQNRWWGCEVLFFRNCDELFGVDHNKQMVANFTQAAKALARDDRPQHRILEEIGIDENDPLYALVGDIRNQTRAMMREIGQMFTQRRGTQGPRGRRGSPEKKAARTATDADRDAMASGEEKPTETDRERMQKPANQREDGLKAQFISYGQAEQDAQDLARMLVQEDLSYQFTSRNLPGYQIFNVERKEGVLLIELNTDHPVYDLLRHVEGRLDEEGDESDPAFQSIVAIRLLLSSWARMEDQTESDPDRRHIQHIAMDWGRQVDKFISQLRERDG